MTNRAFGLTWSCICTCIALFPLLAGGAVRWYFLFTAAIVALVAALLPVALSPLNQAWTYFGKVMHGCISNIALFMMYYLVVVPGGLLLRMFGRRRLVLLLDDTATSYWATRGTNTEAETDFTKPY